MNRRWICNDVLMDILPFFGHAQLGLKLALLSPRFNALVDKHFDGKSELTIWRQINIRKAIGPKPKFTVLIDGKSVEFPLPDSPMPDKIRFKDLRINYLDHSVITFLRSNKRIWDRMGTNLTFYLYSLDADDEPIWEAFTREIWPIYATNIRHLQFTYAYHLDDLRRLISPTILTDLVNQLDSINSYLFPDVIADDGPNATAGQALSKWLNTPRKDGQPKQLFCAFIMGEASAWVNNFKEAFLRATTSVSYNIMFTNYSIFVVSPQIDPFQLVNKVTQEKLTLMSNASEKSQWQWVMKRCPIGGETAAINDQQMLDKLNGLNFFLHDDCLGPLSPPDQSDAKMFSTLGTSSDQRNE